MQKKKKKKKKPSAAFPSVVCAAYREPGPRLLGARGSQAPPPAPETALPAPAARPGPRESGLRPAVPEASASARQFHLRDAWGCLAVAAARFCLEGLGRPTPLSPVQSPELNAQQSAEPLGAHSPIGTLGTVPAFGGAHEKAFMVISFRIRRNRNGYVIMKAAWITLVFMSM